MSVIFVPVCVEVKMAILIFSAYCDSIDPNAPSARTVTTVLDDIETQKAVPFLVTGMCTFFIERYNIDDRICDHTHGLYQSLLSAFQNKQTAQSTDTNFQTFEEMSTKLLSFVGDMRSNSLQLTAHLTQSDAASISRVGEVDDDAERTTHLPDDPRRRALPRRSQRLSASAASTSPSSVLDDSSRIRKKKKNKQRLVPTVSASVPTSIEGTQIVDQGASNP